MSLPKGKINNTAQQCNLTDTPFLMLQAHPDDFQKMARQSQNNIHDETVLSKLFFHPENVKIIQKMIIREVYIRSNREFLIEPQNPEDLMVVMRAIFLRYAKHHKNNIREQIRELDELVVDDVIPDVISQIKAYFGYLDDVFGERKIMDHGINSSSKGMKTLPSVTSRYSS